MFRLGPVICRLVQVRIIHHNATVASVTEIDPYAAVQRADDGIPKKVNDFVSAVAFCKTAYACTVQPLTHLDEERSKEGKPGRWSNRYLHSDHDDVTAMKKRDFYLHKASPPSTDDLVQRSHLGARARRCVPSFRQGRLQSTFSRTAYAVRCTS